MPAITLVRRYRSGDLPIKMFSKIEKELIKELLLFYLLGKYNHVGVDQQQGTNKIRM